MSDNSAILEEGGVYVSKVRVTVGGTTYPISGITSVHAGTLNIAPDQSLSIILFFAGMFGLFGGLFGAILSASSSIPVFVSSIIVGILGLLAFFASGRAVKKAKGKTFYLVSLGTAGGDEKVLKTLDHDFAIRVWEAIQQAITERG